MSLKYGGKMVDDYSAMRGPCPEGFHIPSKGEWDNTNGLARIMNSLGITRPIDQALYLCLPPAGGLQKDGTYTVDEGYPIRLRTASSSLDGTSAAILLPTTPEATLFYLTSFAEQYEGLSIRPFKDKPVVPDSSWTVIYDGSSGATGAGIFLNKDLGLISISDNGTNWKTIADKNLGATTVYEGGKLTEANCGKFYQRGNNYGFPGPDGQTPLTSTSKIDTSEYGLSDNPYYSSDRFIIYTDGYTWQQEVNTNLRGGTRGVVKRPAKVTKRYYRGKKIKDYSAMQGPSPEGFHVPSADEWQGLKAIMDGLSLTTGDDWNIYLHMPFAGYRHYSNASLSGQGSRGVYWSSSPYSANPDGARLLHLDSSDVGASEYGYRASGRPVRCFKDSYATPDSSWTIEQGTLGSAGIFRNESLGLISITDGNTGYTIMDKNLGATEIYYNGDALTQEKLGNMYQRGNNYGFPSVGTISNTSSEQVDTSAYGSGNYYSSDTFITGNNDWSFVRNGNLRGGVTGIQEYPVEVKEVYHGTKLVYPESKYKTFTIKRTENTDVQAMVNSVEYLDDAAGLDLGSAEFDKLFGYYACRLSNNGTETAKVEQTYDGDSVKLEIADWMNSNVGDDIMICFPRRGIKMEKNDKTITLSITDNPHAEDEGFQYYAFDKGYLQKAGHINASIPTKRFYIGAFEMNANAGATSLPAGSPGGGTFTQHWDNAMNKNANKSVNNDRYTYANWGMMRRYQREYITALYMLKYGNPNSQAVIGKGNENGTKSTRGASWAFNQSLATWGDTTSSTKPMRLFGIENFWGNTSEWHTGLKIGANKNAALSLWYSTYDTVNLIPDDNDIMYVKTSYIPSGDFYAKNPPTVEIAGDNMGMFYPMKAHTSVDYSKGYCDFTSIGTNAVVHIGGNHKSGVNIPGIFCLGGTFNTTTGADQVRSSRLLYM